MSRLPIVGGDSGTWGDVLNDFLSVSHNTDGTLKQSALPLDIDGTLASNSDSKIATQKATKSYIDTGLGTKEPKITAGTISQYLRGDKSWQTLDKAAIGLGNVDNTADDNKPVSTAVASYVNNAAAPIGSISAFGGTSAPNGWMMCYGQAISRSTYSDLFTAIGTTYGSGDGSSTFNLPDLRGRVIAGLDNMGGTSADRLTGLAGGVNGDVLGAAGGAQSHTLTVAEMPSHGHYRDPGTPGIMLRWDGTSAFGYQAGSGSFGSTTGIEPANYFQNAGGNGAHNNLQPTIIVSYIIKAFNGSSYSGVDPINILRSVYPVGSVYFNATNNTNPATLLGFGTWVAWGTGRVPVGVDTGQSEFNTQEKTGGAKTHSLSLAEMPSHNHTIYQHLTLAEVGGYGLSGSSSFMDRVIVDSSNPDFGTTYMGSGAAHNNLQPYITVYMWKRTV